MLLVRSSLSSACLLSTRVFPPSTISRTPLAATTSRMSSSAAAADPTIDIAKSTCEPCRGDSPAVRPEDYPALLSQLSPEWRIEPFQKNTAPALQREFKFKNFKYALQFGNAIGEIAETKGIKHHPAIVIEWGRVTCAWWTHAIDGLHKNDFICAAKVDEAATTASGIVSTEAI